METKIAEIKKYFETPQLGAVAAPRYAAFALSLLERAHPSFIDVIASYSLEGEVTLHWQINIKESCSLFVSIVPHIDDSDDESVKESKDPRNSDGESVKDPEDFDILTSYHTRGPWKARDISFSDKEKVAELFEAFEKSTTFDELITRLFS